MLFDDTYEGNPAELPGLTLAYIGDAVYELYVRQQVLKQSVKAHTLHQLAVRRVNNNTPFFCSLKYSFTSLVTVPLNRINAIKFGIAIKPFSVCAFDEIRAGT